MTAVVWVLAGVAMWVVVAAVGSVVLCYWLRRNEQSYPIAPPDNTGDES